MSTAPARDRIDLAAAALSAACLIHCLALPVAGAMVPLLAAWSEVEWAHKALVLTAAPLSLFVIIGRSRTAGGRIFALAAFAGLALLIAAAFSEALHAYERPLTALGGVILGGAHLAWWLRHRARANKRSVDA